MFGLSNSVQLVIFIKSVSVGFLCGSVFFLLYTAAGSGRILRAAAAVIAFALASVISFMFCLEVNFGIPRLYIFAGEAAGFTVAGIFVKKLKKKHYN